MEARTLATAEMSDCALVALAPTDAKGQVAEANALAGAILAEDDGLTIREGALRAARGEDGAELARLIREAAGSRVMPMSGVMRVSRPSRRRPLPVVVLPTRNALSPFGRSHAVCVSSTDPRQCARSRRRKACGSEMIGTTGPAEHLQTGGANNVTGTLTLNGFGTYDPQGGTLSADTITVNNGGSFYFNGGTANFFTFNLNGGTVAAGTAASPANPTAVAGSPGYFGSGSELSRRRAR
jgi:hypothetical protein